MGSSDESKEKDLKSSPSILASPSQNSLTSIASSSLMLKSSLISNLLFDFLVVKLIYSSSLKICFFNLSLMLTY